MKRFVILLSSALITFSSAYFASDIDLSSLSDEEIVSLKDSVIEEMKSRGIPLSETMLAGYYEIGVDIAAGKYTFTPVESEISLTEVFETQEDKDNDENGTFYYPTLDDPAYIALEDGQWIYLLETQTISKAEKSVFAP